MLNHFQFNSCLVTKLGLYRSLAKWHVRQYGKDGTGIVPASVRVVDLQAHLSWLP
jgi:hypothetical protein